MNAVLLSMALAQINRSLEKIDRMTNEYFRNSGHARYVIGKRQQEEYRELDRLLAEKYELDRLMGRPVRIGDTERRLARARYDTLKDYVEDVYKIETRNGDAHEILDEMQTIMRQLRESLIPSYPSQWYWPGLNLAEIRDLPPAQFPQEPFQTRSAPAEPTDESSDESTDDSSYDIQADIEAERDAEMEADELRRRLRRLEDDLIDAERHFEAGDEWERETIARLNTEQRTILRRLRELGQQVPYELEPESDREPTRSAPAEQRPRRQRDRQRRQTQAITLQDIAAARQLQPELVTPIERMSFPESAFQVNPVYSREFEEDTLEFAPLKVSGSSLDEELIKVPDETCKASTEWMKENCSTCQSMVTLEEFTAEDEPDVLSFKVFNPRNGKFGKGQCVKRSELREMLRSDYNTEMPSRFFTLYKKKDPNAVYAPGDSERGMGTEPTNMMVVQLNIGILTIYVSLESALRLFNPGPDGKLEKRFYAIPLFGGKRRRVGNIKGALTVTSANHGQVPGFVIYKLYSQSAVKSGVEASHKLFDFVFSTMYVKPLSEMLAIFNDTTEIRKLVMNHIIDYVTTGTFNGSKERDKLMQQILDLQYVKRMYPIP